MTAASAASLPPTSAMHEPAVPLLHTSTHICLQKRRDASKLNGNFTPSHRLNIASSRTPPGCLLVGAAEDIGRQARERTIA
jgi:hypothetical protein